MAVKSGLRLISFYALLIATTVQGVTPGTYTVVSAWALQRLDTFASAGQADTRYGGIPNNDRPAPSNDADHDGAQDESAIPNEHWIETIHSQPQATPSDQMAWANVLCGTPLRGPAPCRRNGHRPHILALSDDLLILSHSVVLIDTSMPQAEAVGSAGRSERHISCAWPRPESAAQSLA